MSAKSPSLFLLIILLVWGSSQTTNGCTGISLRAKDGSFILSRTIEWAGGEQPSSYVVVPRNHSYTSYTPAGENGLSFTARWGFVGIALVKEQFVTDGINERGLSAGLFYFPGGYGSYPPYNPQENAKTLADLQLVAWMLSQFERVEEVMEAVHRIRITSLVENSVVHWRIADASGREVVLEIVDGEPHFYENRVGVITNSPGFEWQVTNLNNYVNLSPLAKSETQLGEVILRPFGAGSGMWGLPGDFSPASRFVRAFFFRATAPQQTTAASTVQQSFQILNNFDVPIGAVSDPTQNPTSLLTATQWCSATDVTHRRYYYRTMHNSSIRCIDLGRIDFTTAHFFSRAIDSSREMVVESVPLQ